MGQWVFEEQRGVRRKPQEAELFRSGQAAEGEYAGNDALVREILQNSVDARRGEDPVRVRLSVHEAEDAPSAERLATYFNRLRAPLTGKAMKYDPKGFPALPCRYLVCEDFGTRGLEGDIGLYQDPDNAKVREDFYWFWRNIGRSGKTGEDLGRWGLGKTVYRAASQTSCMFGLTVRDSDAKKYLMGQAVLRIHKHDGVEYEPEGYWCDDTLGEGGLTLPIEAVEAIQSFRDEWKLTRNDEPGLSIVAPYIHPDIHAQRLLEAVAIHFFLRIIRGELIVEVCGQDVGETRLDASTIETCCESLVWNGPRKMKRHVAPPIAFARKCLALSEVQSTELLGETVLPKTDHVHFPEEKLHDLRSRFAAEELLGLKVHIWLPLIDGGGVEGHAYVYLQRLRDGTRCESYYVREGMTITKLTSTASKRGVRSLVIITPGPLAELLGDTEGPAHEDWETSNERPNEKWKTWKGRVGYIRKVVDNLVQVLTPPVTEPDFDLLSNFFSIEQVLSPQRQPKVGKDEKKPSSLGQIESNPKWYTIRPRPGGFGVVHNKALPIPDGAMLRVFTAYDISSGNPVKNWSPLDYRIGSGKGDLVPRGEGLQAKSEAGNIVLLTIQETGFGFQIDGFDKDRDLFVRIDEVTDDEESTS